MYLRLFVSAALDSLLLTLMHKKELMAIKIVKNIHVYLYKKNVFLKIKELKAKFAKFVILQQKFRKNQLKKQQERLRLIKKALGSLK